MPTARFYEESSFGVTLYDGTPDQKITFTSFPYDWLEASLFYTNIQDRPYEGFEYQDYKDKGFNFRLRLREEDTFPAIAIGINDIAGTGLYSSEYIVGTYGLRNFDLHFGLGWGNLNGSRESFKNPLGYIDDRFYDRPLETEDKGGQFQPSRYFSGYSASPFFGLSYALNKKILLKAEYDSTLTPGKINYEEAKSDISLGIEYAINDNFSIGISSERGNYFSLKFLYKNNSKKAKPVYKYKPARQIDESTKYERLIKNIENNGIGVNKIIETEDSIGIELTQFIHPNLDIVEEIIKSASADAGIKKELKKEYRVADLKGISEYDDVFAKNAKLIYERKKAKSFRTDTKISVRPFIASREEFFKAALLLENDSEYVIRDNLFFTSNLKYSLWDNFDDLRFPPRNTYPAQVRSDVKDYLKAFNDGIVIGRAQFDFLQTIKKDHHFMATAGILEEMFLGAGFEYLFFKEDSNYALGFEVFDVQKRDYKMRFGTLDYKNTTGSINFYYRNFNIIPFDAKISYGEYLAGDEGVTIDLSRSFKNGTKFGVFATFTDVSTEQFGEGSFDKGIFWNIPIAGNAIAYTWRPLTKDPGSKLVRSKTLHDLLVRFRPIN